ncbi:AraC family transcriptional regulator [Maribacter sp. MJ134]|uniref:AraC family transcriptional regulator n=1 Tax=Maribacter sp. MJ134 TaxID=2496865 RepID=UPI000F823CCD|nr:AraC family transcriptional regulator [Maribacter sp. MJ134]AZQ57834.1 AraC family transcriptional regulator [Maribacter sp. MJ134]
MKPLLEQIVFEKAQSIFAFEHNKENFEMPWHFHPQHELTYIEESVGTKFVGDYVGPYEPGELVLLRSNLPHCWKNHSRCNGVSKSIVIQWNQNIYAKAPELAPVFNLLKSASRGVLFNKEESKDLISKIKGLVHLRDQDLYIQLLLVLVELSKCDFTYLSEASFVSNLPEEYGSRMTKINDFVASQYHRKIFLKEVAEIINMSEQSFSRFFSKMMGRPFFTFLNEYRINIAARKLIDTDDSISEIGFSCGYESLPFFFKKFKDFHNTSPKQYRKKFIA